MSSDIIPHKNEFVQVGIPENTDENQTLYKNNLISGKNGVGIPAEVYRLYDAGLNVFPQPRGSKGGYPWKRLQYSRLSRDDRNYGLHTLFADNCNLAVMCGRTSGNLFVIDCESADAFRYHLQQLRQREIPLWAVRTARGGHIYLRAADGEVENIEPGILANTEIKGKNGYVLAPPSIHPTGAVYQWIIQEGTQPPTVHSSTINWLTDISGMSVTLETTSVSESNLKKGKWSPQLISPFSHLSLQTRQYIEQGHAVAEGERNNRLFKAACDLCGNQYSEQEAHALLGAPALLSGLHAAEIDQTIKSAFSKKREPAKKNQQPVHQQSRNSHWYHALLWIINQSWKQSTGASDRALALALIERARVSSSENGIFRASIRELAQLAKLGTTTIQRSLKRLESSFIHSRGFDNTSQAALWAFETNVIETGIRLELNLNTIALPPHWLRYSESLFNSDLVERAALGHSVLFIYQFLMTLDAPMMPAEIADSLGISLNQVNYGLRKLKLHALIRRDPAGWVPVSMTLPQVEAIFTEVDGAGERRAARFRREREVFAGRILFAARLRSEGRSYLRAVRDALAAYDVAADPLLLLGLELGGVLRGQDGSFLTRDDLFC